MNDALDTRMEVETPEQVVFPYRVAGPGPRGVAWLFDAIVRVALLFGAALFLACTGIFTGLSGLGGATLLLFWFALDWGWYTLWDGLAEGRSPGKILMSLRVIRQDGGSIGWREAVLRNLLRPADAFPFGYVVGVLLSTADARFRRLGDRVAGTVVVHADRAVVKAAARPFPKLDPSDLVRLPPRLRLSLSERVAVEQWLEAREKLGEGWAKAVAERVAPSIGVRHRLHHPDPVRLLELLAYAVHLNGSRIPAPPAASTLRPLLDQARMDANDVSRLGSDYRSLCAELGRRRGLVSPDELAPYETMVAETHGRLYRVPTRLAFPNMNELKNVIFAGFPQEFRRSGRFMLISAGLFVVPMILAAALSVSDVGFVEKVLPSHVRDGMAEAYSDAPERSANQNTMMAGFYVWNNVGIALRSVGAGFFGCMGTAWVLVYNGLTIGTVAGFLGGMGLGGNLLRFTCGHSPWELTALVIAGGAGLKLGWALIAPGELTRSAALSAVGPAVGVLSGGAAVMLMVAASIEGFWSAQALPDVARAVFAVANAVIVSVWLARGGRT